MVGKVQDKKRINSALNSLITTAQQQSSNRLTALRKTGFSLALENSPEEREKVLIVQNLTTGKKAQAPIDEKIAKMFFRLKEDTQKKIDFLSRLYSKVVSELQPNIQKDEDWAKFLSSEATRISEEKRKK